MQLPSYVALSQQTALQRQVEVIANNLANISTPAFKSDRLIFSEFVQSAGDPADPTATMSFVREVGSVRDLRDGAIAPTGNTFDFAIQGPGYFAVQAPGGTRYTRNGTFHLDGQGRVLAGAICGPDAIINGPLMTTLRGAGMTLSPFNAWVVLKGLETLGIRMAAQSANALKLAQWLEQQPAVDKVYYPGLPSHPQHALAMAQQNNCGGAVVSFTTKPAAGPITVTGNALGDDALRLRQAAFHVIDQTELCSITSNLGDTKTLITHPSSTSHGRLTEDQRLAAGITQGMIRVAVGLEHIDDLTADLARGLSTLNF